MRLRIRWALSVIWDAIRFTGQASRTWTSLFPKLSDSGRPRHCNFAPSFSTFLIILIFHFPTDSFLRVHQPREKFRPHPMWPRVIQVWAVEVRASSNWVCVCNSRLPRLVYFHPYVANICCAVIVCRFVVTSEGGFVGQVGVG